MQPTELSEHRAPEWIVYRFILSVMPGYRAQCSLAVAESEFVVDICRILFNEHICKIFWR